MSKNEVISNQAERDQRSREGAFSMLPHLFELVDLWADYLEFWDRSGGLDNATQEELNRAYNTIKARAEEHYPNDVKIAIAYTNLALHTARGIRTQSLQADPGELL
jgi:hypothetical protein